jgi:nicotinamidase-related amidase
MWVMMGRIELQGPEAFEQHCWAPLLDEETRAVYASYKRPTFLDGAWALVMVDPYACLFPSERMSVLDSMKANDRGCGQFAWDAQEPMLALMALAREHGAPVLVTTASTKSDARTATNRAASPNPDGDYVLQPGFEVRPGEFLVEKELPSGFHETDLDKKLRDLGVTSVVLGGATVSGCLRATAVDAHSHGYHTVIVEEAVFDRSELNHRVNLFDLHHKYADVVPLDVLAGALARSAAGTKEI